MNNKILKEIKKLQSDINLKKILDKVTAKQIQMINILNKRLWRK